MRSDDGSASLLTILLLPLMVLTLAAVIDLGALRLGAARARAAADLAALVAVNDQAEPSAGGTLRLAPDAELVAREYFELNLAGSASFLAGNAAAIAQSADVAAFPAVSSPRQRNGLRAGPWTTRRHGSMRSNRAPTIVISCLNRSAAGLRPEDGGVRGGALAEARVKLNPRTPR